MKYQTAWVRSLEKDLARVSEKEFEAINNKVESILDSPNDKTKKIKGFTDNVRSLRIGKKRLIILVEDSVLTVYILAFLSRGKAYSKQSKKNIERNVKLLNSRNNITLIHLRKHVKQLKKPRNQKRGIQKRKQSKR